MTYAAEYFAGVRSLWQAIFPDDPPWNAAERAIPAKLAVQPDLLLAAVDGQRVVGSIMAGYDGHRGWLYALAVAESYRGQGVGTALVHEAEARLRAQGCGKINLQIRTSNAEVVEFYARLGYVAEDRVSMGKRLIASSNDLGSETEDHVSVRYIYFELTRAADGLVYQFDRQARAEGQYGYKRRDRDVWIIFKQEFGWVSYDEATKNITGRPWNVLPRAQGDHPPEGAWVSKKADKSYVYVLAYRDPRDGVPSRAITDAQ